MKKVEQTEGATSLMKYKEEFETVFSIIATHRKRVIRIVNNESMSMVWEVGGLHYIKWFNCTIPTPPHLSLH